MPVERTVERLIEMLLGLAFMHHYWFLKITQFARVSSLSLPHTREVLRGLLYRRSWCGPPAILPLLFF